jgi:hypothetical protein
MKSFRTSGAGFLLSVALIPAIAQTISSADAKNHIGERATVCGLVANQHVAPQSQGKPTFIDLDSASTNWNNAVRAESSLISPTHVPTLGTVCNDYLVSFPTTSRFQVRMQCRFPRLGLKVQ